MGSVRDELTDPWGGFLGAVLGGLTWAVVTGPVGIAAGVGVGAAVYGAKVVTGVLLGEPAAGPQRPATPARPAPGTAAATWLDRADRALADLREQARSPGPGATGTAAAHTAEQAAGVVAMMRRLGGQSVAVAEALERAEGDGLDEAAVRLRAAAERSPGDPSARRSAEAVAERVAARDRLRTTREALDARLQSGALGLEGLAVQVAELRAMATDAGAVDPSAGDLQALSDGVSGLRRGLAEVERTAGRILGEG